MDAGTAKGFTLIEFIIALAVTGVLAGIAVPSFNSLVRRTEVRTVTNALSTTLAAARLRAITYRTPVSVCPSSDGIACSGGVDWDDGWITFDDPARSGVPRNTESVLQRGSPLRESVHVTATTGRRLVRFLPNGTAAGTNVTLTACGRGVSRAVVVSNSGRARIDASPTRSACS